jgi:hypothetical protein
MCAVVSSAFDIAHRIVGEAVHGIQAARRQLHAAALLPATSVRMPWSTTVRLGLLGAAGDRPVA